MKTILMTLFLLLSLSYSSTMLSYERNVGSSVIDTFCEDVKEDSKTDKSDDKLDILLSEKLCVQISTVDMLAVHQSMNYTFTYRNPLYKPPLFS